MRALALLMTLGFASLAARAGQARQSPPPRHPSPRAARALEMATDPDDPQAFIDVLTDIDPLFVISDESGRYEGWMIYDLTVPNSAPPRSDGSSAWSQERVADPCS